jgi:hypothetical protein
MESNLFPIFLIGFLISIILLLQKSTSKAKPTQRKVKTNKLTKKIDTPTKLMDTQALAAAQSSKTAQWHKLKNAKEKVQEPLFSNEWQNQFKQYNERLPNQNFETPLPKSIFNTKEQTWDTMTLTETFTNQGSYINSFAQNDAIKQHSSGIDNSSRPYLINTPVAATEFELSGKEHFWALQEYDSFY